MLNKRVIYFVVFISLVMAFALASYFLRQPVREELLPASIGRILGASPERILIKFKDGIAVERKNKVMSDYGFKEKSDLKQIGVKMMTLPLGHNPQLIVESLIKNEADAIEFAEPDYIVEPSLLPNDPWFANWQKDKQQMNAPGAWDKTSGLPEIILAVADTGVNCSHEDLAGKCVEGWNFYQNNSDTADVHGHGTAVAGVAAAVGNNSLGVAGMTWQTKIMPLRVSAASGTATYSAIASAIIYAADHGAKVVNNSYQTGGSSTVQRAARYLEGKGGLLVVSEGNYGSDTGYANDPNIISVSAVDSYDVRYSWSSFGRDVDIAAPGCTGATTLMNGGYGSFCGTSNAAPEIAGVLMLIWSANMSLAPNEVRDILFRSAYDLGTGGWDQYYGWGRVNAGAAIDTAIQYSQGAIMNSTPTPTPERVRRTPRPKI